MLDHFPTREAMLGATIRSLMERNEAAVRQAEAEVPADLDRVIRVLCASTVHPAFVAELELWAAARTDAALRKVLRDEEERARVDLHRVVGEVFGADLVSTEHYPLVAALTVQFLRGLAISDVLRGERSTERLIADWAAAVRAILTGRPVGVEGVSSARSSLPPRRGERPRLDLPLARRRDRPGERTGTFRLGGDEMLVATDGSSFISAEDYAVALVDELEQNQAVQRRFTVAY